MSFKERLGLIQKKPISMDSMNESLRTKIWDIYYVIFQEDYSVKKDIYIFALQVARHILCMSIADFKERNNIVNAHAMYTDDLYSIRDFREKIRHFIFFQKWFDICELLEFTYTYNNMAHQVVEVDTVNNIFEKENFGYRFNKEGKLLPITNNEELQEIQNTRELTKEGSNHFKNAIEAFSRKGKPDYNKTIEESIKGLEAICREISGLKNSTLGESLKHLKKQENFKIFYEGIDKIWGFTSNNFRHTQKPNSITLSFHDAKLILVLASALANYIYSLKENKKD